MTSPAALIESSRKIEFRWEDKLGLAGKEPFSLAVTAREDEAPSLATRNCPARRWCSTLSSSLSRCRAAGRFRHQAGRDRVAGG